MSQPNLKSVTHLKPAGPIKMGHWGNLLIFNGKFVCKLPT